MELEGKVAIVTGGSRGIGEGIARTFAREGAKVVVASRNADDAKRMAADLEASGARAIGAGADVSRAKDVEAMVARTVEAFGTVDILVNNAGIEAPPSMLTDLTEEQWDCVLDVNLKGAFLCCRAVLPVMMDRRYGKIVNIGSLAGLRMSFFGSADYTASKHGLTGLTQHLAWEVADYGINVNAICPGAVMTPLMESGTTPELRAALTKRLVPLGSFCTTGDIGEAASFLASDRARMITGQSLAVDGGVMTGYGEDLRALVRQRMDAARSHAATAA